MTTRVRRVAGKRRPNRNAKAAGGFGVFSIFGLLAYAIGYGIVAIIVAVVSGLVAGVFAALQVRDNGGRLTRPRVEATTRRTYAVPQLAKNYVYKTRKQRALSRRRNVERGIIHTGTTKMSGPGCSIKCRESRVPKALCRCRGCGGADHGSARGFVPTPRMVSEIITEVAKPRKPKTKKAKGKKPATEGDTPPKTRPAARTIKPRDPRKIPLPGGPVHMPVIMVWRNDADQLVRVQTTKATADQTRAMGRMVSCKKVEGWVDVK